jgi:hypothetical protein
MLNTDYLYFDGNNRLLLPEIFRLHSLHAIIEKLVKSIGYKLTEAKFVGYAGKCAR